MRILAKYMATKLKAAAVDPFVTASLDRLIKSEKNLKAFSVAERIHNETRQEIITHTFWG